MRSMLNLDTFSWQESPCKLYIYIYIYIYIFIYLFTFCLLNFCFPSDLLYIILPSITLTVFQARHKSENKNSVLKSETLNLFQNNRVNSMYLHFCHSTGQFKFSVCPSILIKLCCLIPFSKYQSISLAALKRSEHDT